MKAIIKGLIIGGIIAAIGVAIVVIALASNGWELKKPVFEMQTYTAETDAASLKIDIGAGSVKTQFYDGDKIIIEYPVSSVYKNEISASETTLSYKAWTKGWFIHFGTLNVPDTIIKLPEGVKYDIELDMGAGSSALADGVYGKIELDIGAGAFSAGNIECSLFECELSAGSALVDCLICNELDCDVSAGALKINKLTCGKSSFDISAGAAKVTYTGAKSEYGITASRSAGSCNVSSQTGTTDKTINVSVSAGSANISFAG